METSDFDFENLFSIFENSIKSKVDKKNYDNFLIAYSGGSDSTALLYFAKKMSEKYGVSIRAVHVNHNLNIESKEWENHCKISCKEMNIPLTIKNINIHLNPGDSMEEKAREERYSSIFTLMNSKTIMMTAHHADDQAETFLYQLIRGSGVKGLSSMPALKKLSKGYHARPFLSLSKSTLTDIVDFSQLSYIYDKSNDDINFSRNFIRKEILPIINHKWPGSSKTISRAAHNLYDSVKLNQYLATIDIKNYLLKDKSKISVNLRELDLYRFKNVIRFWILKNNYRMPSMEQTYSIYSNIFKAGNDKSPVFSCSEYEIRRYNDYVEIMSPLKKHDPSKVYTWEHRKNLIISNLSINLSWEKLEKRLGYKLEKDAEVKFRKKGQNIKLDSKRSLKDYMRENKIPPWQRERTLLIYIDKELKIIWD